MTRVRKTVVPERAYRILEVTVVLMNPSTQPWTVPSPAEKGGGLGKGLQPFHVKKTQIITKQLTKGTLLNLGEGGPPGESMTPCSESCKEATSLIPFLYSKKISKIGTWNVRTKLITIVAATKTLYIPNVDKVGIKGFYRCSRLGSKHCVLNPIYSVHIAPLH